MPRRSAAGGSPALRRARRRARPRPVVDSSRRSIGRSSTTSLGLSPSDVDAGVSGVFEGIAARKVPGLEASSPGPDSRWAPRGVRGRFHIETDETGAEGRGPGRGGCEAYYGGHDGPRPPADRHLRLPLSGVVRSRLPGGGQRRAGSTATPRCSTRWRSTTPSRPAGGDEFDTWRERAPEGFLYAVKGEREYPSPSPGGSGRPPAGDGGPGRAAGRAPGPLPAPALRRCRPTRTGSIASCPRFRPAIAGRWRPGSRAGAAGRLKRSCAATTPPGCSTTWRGAPSGRSVDPHRRLDLPPLPRTRRDGGRGLLRQLRGGTPASRSRAHHRLARPGSGRLRLLQQHQGRQRGDGRPEGASGRHGGSRTHWSVARLRASGSPREPGSAGPGPRRPFRST